MFDPPFCYKINATYKGFLFLQSTLSRTDEQIVANRRLFICRHLLPIRSCYSFDPIRLTCCGPSSVHNDPMFDCHSPHEEDHCPRFSITYNMANKIFPNPPNTSNWWTSFMDSYLNVQVKIVDNGEGRSQILEKQWM